MFAFFRFDQDFAQLGGLPPIDTIFVDLILSFE